MYLKKELLNHIYLIVQFFSHTFLFTVDFRYYIKTMLFLLDRHFCLPKFTTVSLHTTAVVYYSLLLAFVILIEGQSRSL